MRPLKILYHHRTASRDGQRVHIEELIHALRQQGHEVLVVEPAAAADAQFGGKPAWVRWIQKRLPKALYELLELAYNVPLYFKLRRAARGFRPDVLYERHHLYLLAGAWLHGRLGLPYLLEVNSPLYSERLRNDGLGLPMIARATERWVWQQADAVLPVTRVLADILVENGVRQERVRVIPNGIDPERFAGYLPLADAKRALGLEGRLVLGFTGFVREWNALDRVIRYLARPGNERMCLLMVGDGPARPALEQLAESLGIADRVVFAGLVDRNRIRDHVAAFDVALQPAANPYASPLKLFEYLALGRAVVAPAQPNLREVLSDGVNAILFDPALADGLELALDRIVRDDALRAALGERAAELIARRDYTWTGNGRRVAALAATLARRPDGLASATSAG